MEGIVLGCRSKFLRTSSSQATLVAMLLAADADSDGTLGCALSCLPLRFLGTSFCLQFAKVGKNFSVLPGPIQKARCSRVLAKFHPVGMLFGSVWQGRGIEDAKACHVVCDTLIPASLVQWLTAGSMVASGWVPCPDCLTWRVSVLIQKRCSQEW